MDHLKKMSIDIRNIIDNHIDTTKALLNEIKNIEEICSLVFKTLKNGNTILLCGNGGSASDSIHIAAEIVGRFNLKDRKSLPAIALPSNQSNITSIGNDFGFEYIFSRQIEGLGKENDLLIALSTSGNSKNILNAITAAKKLNIKTIGFTGLNGGAMSDLDCDYLLKIKSNDTARIQEIHILVAHIICDYIDSNI
tara:strand:+ start:3275 stop:3859 length:585 start_codon:yes stop_codon:yes gene_type:complete